MAQPVRRSVHLNLAPSQDDLARQAIFEELDLSRVMAKLREDMTLTEEQAAMAELWYRRHLWLCYKYPDALHVPLTIVDEIWHRHILFTRAYMADCDRIFGRYLHHSPYVGAEKGDLRHSTAFRTMATLFEDEFGEPIQTMRERFPDQPQMANSSGSLPPEEDCA